MIDFRRVHLLLVTALVVLFAVPVPLPAASCTACGATGISDLTMLCPQCGADLHSPSLRRAANSQTGLTIEIFYTGDRPQNLPDTGKVRINGKPAGDIVIEDREKRDPTLQTASARGIGFDYTGRNRFSQSGKTAGQVAVEVEFLFPRARGLLTSRRVLRYPYVPLTSGRTTTLRYSFAVPRDFGSKPKPDLKAALASDTFRFAPRTASGSKPLLPLLPVRLAPASGGAQLEMPVPELY